MKKAFYLLTFIFTCNLAFAQKMQRFKNEVFISIDSLKNIQYGEAKNINSESEKLFLDIYSPKADTLKNRPLVIFVHGGGFVNGDKGTGYPILFCTGLAKRGYLSSSINYRLGIEKPKMIRHTSSQCTEGCRIQKPPFDFLEKMLKNMGSTPQIFM